MHADSPPADWPISGFLTVVWLLRFMIQRCGACMAFHDRWVTETRLDYSSSGVVEHQGLCRTLDCAVMFDVLDLSRIAAFEIVARRIQMIHDKWKHKLPQYQSLGDTGGDEAHLLLGVGETRGQLGIAPSLTRWLGKELGREASVNKERRKAREERALAAAPPPKK